jgi:hypothetical protein
MKIIKLTQGQFSQVDDEDYEFLNQFKWQAYKAPNTYYAMRESKGKTIRMHRIIMKTPSNLMVDHIDHNGLNNQKINLRNCNASQNQCNKKPIGSSIYLGVNICIRATIRINNKNVNLGSFKTEIEAAKAYDKAAKENFGEFANLNFK